MAYFNLSDLGLPEDIWSSLTRKSPLLHCGKGQVIYMKDTWADCFFCLKSGKVKTFISSEDGTERMLAIYQEGSLFGEAAFFDGKPRMSTAMALTDCEVYKISRLVAQREIAARPELAMALLKYLAHTVRLLSDQMDDMAFLRTDQRIAQYLLSLTPDREGGLDCSQEEIAASAGVSRVTVSRTLKSFREQGWLATGYRTLILLQPEELRKLADSAGA